jgi:hypothetical protein
MRTDIKTLSSKFAPSVKSRSCRLMLSKATICTVIFFQLNEVQFLGFALALSSHSSAAVLLRIIVIQSHKVASF